MELACCPGLKDATKDIMRVFHSKTKGRKPEAILFYRDGVAEGQFKVVLAEEYAAIRQVDLGSRF